ncbi:MAG TPA: penicillin-binding protein, partial [Pseudothermotoga sp.]|nr:penicillin-binding protein [Pseudothermotoga sp.]
MKRLKVIVYLMATIPFLILLARAFVLQILQRESHREYVDSLKVYVRQIEAPRGKILTNDGSPIAWDEEVLVARSTGLMDPSSVEEVVGPERKLKLLLGEEIIVTEAEAIKLQKTGVLISRKYIRKYSNLAPHVVGYIDIDRKGMSGVEKEYDSYLRGTNGYELISISPSGKT